MALPGAKSLLLSGLIQGNISIVELSVILKICFNICHIVMEETNER